MRVGKIFAESVEVFQAYELYCSKQPEAISLLESLQKKNEVLRVFLNVSSIIVTIYIHMMHILYIYIYIHSLVFVDHKCACSPSYKLRKVF